MVPTRNLPTTLHGFQKMIDGIYGDAVARLYSKKQLVLILYSLLGRSARAARKSKAVSSSSSKQSREIVLDLFRWYLCFCNFVRLDAADALWEKYPNVCPYGLERKNCDCEDKPHELKGPSLTEYRQRKGRPRTIRSWQGMFRRIYGEANARRGVEYAFRRLLEEITEVLDLTLPNITNFNNFKKEMADVGARIFSLATLLEIDLQGGLLARYRGVCPDCTETPCTACRYLWSD